MGQVLRLRVLWLDGERPVRLSETALLTEPERTWLLPVLPLPVLPVSEQLATARTR